MLFQQHIKLPIDALVLSDTDEHGGVEEQMGTNVDAVVSQPFCSRENIKIITKHCKYTGKKQRRVCTRHRV